MKSSVDDREALAPEEPSATPNSLLPTPHASEASRVPEQAKVRGDALLGQWDIETIVKISQRLIDEPMAILLLEDDGAFTDSARNLAQHLDTSGTENGARLATLVREHDHRLGVPMVIVFKEGDAVFSIWLPKSVGAA